ncbi:hypothetical protein IV203_016816 [Nitzschia inconspicua]|uniref:PDZ domain-containing protein n=1 Tax=Nitzschia inconspicua TaxID=303405 RepID=A0A9K3KR73_9STRA|nr:hypothetical protein IV203_016816 [Nitzschia inconspicua]
MSTSTGFFASAQQHQLKYPIDSPGTSTISSSIVSSFDEDFSPLPLQERLGRVVSSSSSSNDFDGDRSGTKTPLPPRRPMVRKTISAGSAQYDQWLLAERLKLEQDRKTKSTLHELQQLVRLATMDSSVYHKQLVDNTLPSLSSKNENQSTPNTNSSLLQNQLMQLSMAIHRLHSIVANLTQDVDAHTDDTQLLQSQLLASQLRTQQVEAVAHKLYRQNQKLKKQTRQDQNVLHRLQSKLRRYENQLETQKNQLLTSQLHQHELQLQLQQKSFQGECGSSISSCRDRTDSTFSELCLEDAGMDLLPSDVGGESDNEIVNSQNMFESTKPTLCFSANGSSYDATDNRLRTWSNVSVGSVNSLEGPNCKGDNKNLEKLPQPENVTDTTDQTNVQEKETANKVDFLKHEKNDRLPRMMSNLNKTFRLFGSTPSNYTLKFIKPFQMQFSVFEVNVNANGESEMKGSVSRSENAFVVVGFDGFDEIANIKPTLGARLVRINGVDVDSKWDLLKLHDAIYTNNEEKSSINLTFRNEEWGSSAQNYALKQFLGKNSEYEGSEGCNIITKQTRSESTDSAHRGVRTRAPSAEAVGRAFGSFIQNLKDNHHNKERSSTTK